jgi:ArsR family transcriptional regulator, cadmium/lead-responsive transcriptional repressor
LHQERLFTIVRHMATITAGVDVSAAAGRLFKVLADPTRLALLRRLAEGEASVGELVAALGNPPKSRVSNHLACLRWCELVTSEKVGRSVIYRLADRSVLSLIDKACKVATPHADHLASCSRIGPEWI